MLLSRNSNNKMSDKETTENCPIEDFNRRVPENVVPPVNTDASSKGSRRHLQQICVPVKHFELIEL